MRIAALLTSQLNRHFQIDLALAKHLVGPSLDPIFPTFDDNPHAPPASELRVPAYRRPPENPRRDRARAHQAGAPRLRRQSQIMGSEPLIETKVFSTVLSCVHEFAGTPCRAGQSTAWRPQNVTAGSAPVASHSAGRCVFRKFFQRLMIDGNMQPEL